MITTCTATHGDDRCTLHATHRGSHYDSMTDYSWRDETMTTYTTTGSVRGGCGHQHATIALAERCLRGDWDACRSLGGGSYSDRGIVAVDDGSERPLDDAEEDRMMTYKAVDSAIRDSIIHARIAQLEWSAEREADLQTRCHDSVDIDVEIEYWGRDDDDDDWRVHLVRPEPGPA